MAGLAQEAEKPEDLTPTVSGAGDQEEQEGADANTSFTDSDGEDDDGDTEASHFQNLIATARQKGATGAWTIQCRALQQWGEEVEQVQLHPALQLYPVLQLYTASQMCKALLHKGMDRQP